MRDALQDNNTIEIKHRERLRKKTTLMMVTSFIQYFRKLAFSVFKKFLYKLNAPSEFYQKYQERIQIILGLYSSKSVIRITILKKKLIKFHIS